MTAQELWKLGRIDEAIQALNAELRSNPTDTKRRIFLFELLCFAGVYDRAEKQLEILAQNGQQAEMGTLIYRAALHAERLRHEMFEKRTYPISSARGEVSGTINGKSFTSLSDADSRIGANLEVFAAGAYLWLPFSVIASVEMAAPKRLRDTLWAPAAIRCSESYQGQELGEVLIPVLAPFAWKHEDPNVRLGRTTVIENNGSDGPLPQGQKFFLADDEEVPVLELRSLVVNPSMAAGGA